MDVFESARTVLAVRQYQDRPVPEESVHRILEAGRLTASSMNRQPWHFILVENSQTLHRLAEIARTGPYIGQAPLAVVVVVEKIPSAVSDGSRAIQTMVLAAWSEGIGSNWVGVQEPEQIKVLLGIPDNLDILAILPFGYPALPVGKGRKKRKSLAEVAHRERFGQPIG